MNPSWPRRAVSDDAQPRFFRLTGTDDRQVLADLLASGAVVDVADTIREQVREWIETRHPSVKLAAADLDERTRAVLGDQPDAYGAWVYFPWSGRLVHILPPDEFREIRTSRNRNKITTAEQERLGRLRLGIAGLSVGQATALTVALEGMGGELRLADFDSLSLSNMNRLRAGVHEIGISKAAITARAIWELDPYRKLTLFFDGVTEANLDAFLGTGPSRLDLLFEECDDLAMKVLLREQARARGIPVVMETSDRGLVDIERFDLEPGRPIFHGLIGPVDPSKLRGLATADKVPFVLAILGQVSARAAASLVDIDATLKTWPQLASAVSLGAGLATDVARRIALGQLQCSGRFYVDLEKLVQVDRALEGTVTPHLPPTDAPVATPLAPGVDPAVERIVRWATLAPSGGNHQPWRCTYRRRERTLDLRVQAPPSFLDFGGLGAHLAIGAAAENARLACLSQGLEASIDWLAAPGVAARIRLGGGSAALSAEDRALAGAVEERATNRRLAPPAPLPSGFTSSLQRAAVSAGAALEMVTDRGVIEAIGEIVGSVEKIRLLHPELHAEMMAEIRWTPEEARLTNDGIDLATLELTASDAAGLRLLRSPTVVRTLREVDGGDGLKKPMRKVFAMASAVGLLSLPAPPAPRTFLVGGQAVERVWLTATAQNVAFQPVTALLPIFGRLAAGGEGFDPGERRVLADLEARFRATFPRLEGTSVMLFRLAIAPPPTVRALRRPFTSVLDVE